MTTPSPGPAAGTPGLVPPQVWAPRARSVELDLPAHGERLSMTPAADGWWVSPHPLAHGTDYAYVLDGRDPVPDPRSAWQPHGVHGPSRTFDTSRHRWADGAWEGRDVRGAVVYELHVGTFTAEGTLDAAIERLDHLADLGVEVVELMPVAAFPGVHGWGYDGVDLYAVHEPYGGPAALQRLVDAAHRRGLAVCLDVVYNHLGPSGNYLHRFGPYFTDRHSTPWGQAVNLDGDGSSQVRAFIVENALRWLREFHVDALRLDAVHALVDDSPRHLLAELSDAVAALAHQLGRPLSLVAESDLNDATMVTPTAEGGLGMTAQWADDVHHALHAFLTGETRGYYADFGSADALAKALTSVFVHAGEWSSFRGRTWGRPVPPGTDPRRFVVFSQDHDQVGNRALGDRPSEHLDAGGLAAAAALVLLSPFTPMLFMGEEWGARTRWQYFTDHAEPDLVEGIRSGRRAEFGGHGWEQIEGGEVTVPDPQAPTTVEASRLDWAEARDAEGARLLSWYQELIALRHRAPELTTGDLSQTVVAHDPAGWFTVRRGGLLVAMSVRDEAVTIPLAETADVLTSFDPVTLRHDRVVLPGRTVAVLRLLDGPTTEEP